MQAKRAKWTEEVCDDACAELDGDDVLGEKTSWLMHEDVPPSPAVEAARFVRKFVRLVFREGYRPEHKDAWDLVPMPSEAEMLVPGFAELVRHQERAYVAWVAFREVVDSLPYDVKEAPEDTAVDREVLREEAREAMRKLLRDVDE